LVVVTIQSLLFSKFAAARPPHGDIIQEKAEGINPRILPREAERSGTGKEWERREHLRPQIGMESPFLLKISARKGNKKERNV
jgi:hypothetical protein